MFNTILFDLDGTLTNPFEGITNCIVYALQKFGISVPDRKTLLPFIGPPLYQSFEKYYGFSRENSLKAVGFYRERFATLGKFENKVYEGIPEVLAELQTRGKRLVLATSKPENFALEIMEHFNLSRYFHYIAGATLDSSRDEKGAVIAYALESCGVKDKSKAIMIGDRMHDIAGAKQNGLKSLGVLYGFGSEEELTSAGADFLAKTPEDLLKIIN